MGDDPNRAPTPVGETSEMTKPLEPGMSSHSTDPRTSGPSSTAPQVWHGAVLIQTYNYAQNVLPPELSLISDVSIQ